MVFSSPRGVLYFTSILYVDMLYDERDRVPVRARRSGLRSRLAAARASLARPSVERRGHSQRAYQEPFSMIDRALCLGGGAAPAPPATGYL